MAVEFVISTRANNRTGFVWDSGAQSHAAPAPVPPPPAPHPVKRDREPRDLKAEAVSLEHLLTHTPRNPYCDACRIAKATRRPARRLYRDPDTKPKKFADLINGDYIVAQSEEAMGLTGERDALALVDYATIYTDCFPLMSRHNSEANGALREFMGDDVPKRIYTDNAPELIRACKDLGYRHDKSTPYRHQSNGFCERTVRKIIEGARALLEQAGLPSCFWIFAVRFWCFAHNIAIKDGE